MSPLTFQELASVGEEALHTGRNVVQILAIGKAVANLISGKNLISPRLGGGLPAYQLDLKTPRGHLEQVAGDNVGSTGVLFWGQRDKKSVKAVLFSIGEVFGRPRSARAPLWTMTSSIAGPRWERSWPTLSARSSRRSTRHASV